MTKYYLVALPTGKLDITEVVNIINLLSTLQMTVTKYLVTFYIVSTIEYLFYTMLLSKYLMFTKIIFISLLR